MADLANLVKSKAKKLSEDNFRQSEKKCREADACINKARQEGGRDKDLVLKAIDLYQESLQANSRHIPAYLGLAYIFFSAGEIDKSIGLLNKALDIEPFNQKARELLPLLKQELKHKSISALVSKEAGKSLSAKLGKRENPVQSGFFEKITSLFFSKPKTAKKPKEPVRADFSKLVTETSNNMKIPTQQQAKGDFFKTINGVVRQNNK